MYTELYLGCELSSKTPFDLVNDIAMLCDVPVPIPGDDDGVMAALANPKATEFMTAMGKHINWPVFCGNSYYFDAQPHARFFWDEISKSYNLTAGADIKNYNQEWETLLDAIAPHLRNYQEEYDNEAELDYVEPPKHIGHYRYEEDETPTLLYHVYKDGKSSIYWQKIRVPTLEQV